MLVKVTLQFELGICPSMGVCRKEAAFNFISFYITTYKSIKIGSKFLGLNLSKITVRIMTHQVERNENKKSIYHGSRCTRDFNAILSFESQTLTFQGIPKDWKEDWF